MIGFGWETLLTGVVLVLAGLWALSQFTPKGGSDDVPR